MCVHVCMCVFMIVGRAELVSKFEFGREKGEGRRELGREERREGK